MEIPPILLDQSRVKLDDRQDLSAPARLADNARAIPLIQWVLTKQALESLLRLPEDTDIDEVM